MPTRFIGSGLTPSFTYGPEKQQASQRIKGRHFISASIFIVISSLFCFYYIAFPLSHLKFTHEYPRFGTPPVPNEFRSARYTWIWVFIYILTALSLMLPFLLASAITNNTMPEYAKIHYFVSRITITVSSIGFIGLSVVWLFFCNTSYGEYSLCHDPRWCCHQYAAAIPWCPNGTPCVPHVSGGELYRDDAFFQVWLLSILFAFWAMGHKQVNKDMQSYGLFREVFTEEQAGNYE